MTHTKTPPQHYETLFARHERNPILTAADWPYPAHTVFNAGATRLPDGTTLLMTPVIYSWFDDLREWDVAAALGRLRPYGGRPVTGRLSGSGRTA